MPPIDPPPEQFAAFWQLYPRKVAKLAALKAWRKLNPDAALVEQIMAGLRAQLPEMLKTYKRDRSMVPHPATWLNGRRFEDEASGAQKTGAARVIACEKCGDTGVVFADGNIESHGSTVLMGLRRCSCGRGQLPGLMTGPIHAEDAL